MKWMRLSTAAALLATSLPNLAIFAQQPPVDPFAPAQPIPRQEKAVADPFGAPDVPFAPEPPGSDPFAEAQVTMFHLTHAKAANVERILRNLFAGDFKAMTVNERRNDIVVKAGPGTTEQIQALLPRLDRQSADSLLQAQAADKSTGGGGSPGAAKDANGVALPDGARVQPDGSQIKIFTLKNARAKDAERTITQLFGRDAQSIAADERSNSLIVRGASDELNLIYHIITRLDELGQLQPQAVQPAKGESAADGRGGLIARPAGSVSELADKYQQLDTEAKRLASQLRELQTAPQAHSGQIKDLTAQLQKAVADAFAARQELHQAEVAQFQERVADIQQTLKTRDKLSKEIIDKRVKDLLNPDLNWVAAGGGGGEGGAMAGGIPAAGGEGAGAFAPAGDDDYWANVKYGARHGDDADIIWNTLGVKVKPVPQNQLPKKNYPFGAQITEIRPGSPADGLKVGDIIVTLSGSAFVSESVLAQMLKAPIKNRTSINFKEFERSEIGVLRDGQTQVFGIKFPLEPPPLEATGTVPRIEPATSSSPAMQNFSLSGSGQAITLRTPADFRRELLQWQTRLDQWKDAKLSEVGGDTEEERARSKEQNIRSFQQRLDLARAEYDAQIRLLELEVKDAASAVEAAQNAERLARERRQKGPGGLSSSEMNELQRALATAKVRLERANTLLELYRKADPKQAGEGKSAGEPVGEAARP